MRIIAGTARSRAIEAPKGRDTRPTLDRVRENLFNILQYKTPGARVLDLFAGSGALSMEAVSRGAASATLVDHDRTAVAVEKRNAAALGFEERTRIIRAEWAQAARALAEEGAAFDLVFLDPPYAMRDLTAVMEAIRPLMSEDALVIIEHEARTMPVTAQSFTMTDSRRYGYVGVSFFRAAE